MIQAMAAGLDRGGGLDATGRAALALAREAVERYVRTGLLTEPPPDLPPELRIPGAAFVTLRAHGDLRGCIGTLVPTRLDRAREIIACAVAAATRDPRFPPVGLEDLPALCYEVDLLEPLEPVRGPEELDPRRYGLVVEAGGRRGVLLPDLEGVENVAQQIAIARRKAGLPPGMPADLYRFQVRRYVEAPPGVRR